MKRPWRTHYTGDWATDPFVRNLDLESRMVYFELLDIAWDEEGLQHSWITFGTYVAKRIGISRRKFLSCWMEVRVKFEEFSPGIWSNSKLEIERKKADLYSENQSNRAKQRWETDAGAMQDKKTPAMPLTSTSQHIEEVSHAGEGVDLTPPDQIWIEVIKLQPGADLLEAWHLAKREALRLSFDPGTYFRMALATFVVYVDGVRPERRPQKSVRKFIEHFPRICEILAGKREAVPRARATDSTAPSTRPREAVKPGEGGKRDLSRG